jgi:hypothetical protein
MPRIGRSGKRQLFAARAPHTTARGKHGYRFQQICFASAIVTKNHNLPSTNRQIRHRVIAKMIKPQSGQPDTLCRGIIHRQGNFWLFLRRQSGQ